MKKFLIVVMLSVAAVVESSAQEHIDALMRRDLYTKSGNREVKLRSGTKRDPQTGEILKRVTELIVKDDRALIKEFVKAFEADCESADTWSYSEAYAGNPEEFLLVWQNPMRVYSLSRNGNFLTVTVQTIYRQEENESVEPKNK
jgi:hypothetical protein